MQSKTLILIFVVTFLTFMVALAAMVVVTKPEMLERFHLERFSATHDGSATPDADRDGDPRPPAAESTNLGTSTILGQVLDESGRPLAGACVHLLEGTSGQSTDTGEVRILAVTNSGADGKFELVLDLNSSPLRVIVNAAGHARWQKNHVAVPADRRVDLGQVTMPSGGTLKVYVRDDQGRSVYGASVTVTDPWDVPDSLRRRDLVAATESDGVAVLRGTDFGQYAVIVSKAGYAASTQTMTFDRVNPMEGFAMEAMLHEARSFIEGTVRDGAGKAVDVGTVTARATRGDHLGEFRVPVMPTGQFKIGPLPRGDYQIQVESPGMTQRAPVVATADAGPAKVIVDYGGSLAGALQSDHPIPDDVAIQLTQRDSRGNLVPFHGGYRSHFDPGTRKFRIDGIPPGSFQVRVTARGFAAGRSEEFAMEPGGRQENLKVDLTYGGTLKGRVLDGRGQTLSRASVTVFEGDTAPPPALASLFAGNSKTAASTSENGTFRLEHLSPGNHVIVIECPGMPARAVGPVRIQEDSEAQLGSFSLGSGASLSGSIVNTQSAAMPGALVRVRSQERGMSLLLVADRTGKYNLRGLAAGTYEVCAVVDGEEQAPVEVHVTADHQIRQDLVQR